MSGEKNQTPNPQEELLRRLKSIGADLWGAAPAAGENSGEPLESDIEKAWRQELAGKSGTAERLQAAKRKETAAPAREDAVPRRPKVTLENLWITADESVDWTEALLRDTPQDGLTGQKRWSFYHRMAPRVLNGDVDAYGEVLTTVNPLGDLAEYVAGMILRTPGPDRLECVFECQRDDLAKSGRDYLGALSLRIARDLLAVLPVSEVGITGNLDGSEKIRVDFRREQLLKKKMAFLSPSDFAEECGGRITL